MKLPAALVGIPAGSQISSEPPIPQGHALAHASSPELSKSLNSRNKNKYSSLNWGLKSRFVNFVLHTNIDVNSFVSKLRICIEADLEPEIAFRVCARYCLDRFDRSLRLDHAHRFLEGQPNVVLVVPPAADGANLAEFEFNPHVEAVFAHPAVRLCVVSRHVRAESGLVLRILRLFAFLGHFDYACFLTLGGALWIDKIVTVRLSVSHIAAFFAESAKAIVKVAD